MHRDAPVTDLPNSETDGGPLVQTRQSLEHSQTNPHIKLLQLLQLRLTRSAIRLPVRCDVLLTQIGPTPVHSLWEDLGGLEVYTSVIGSISDLFAVHLGCVDSPCSFRKTNSFLYQVFPSKLTIEGHSGGTVV